MLVFVREDEDERARARGFGSVHMSTGFEIGILNSRHFCFDVSRPVIRSVGVYQRARAPRGSDFFILTNSLLRFIGFRTGISAGAKPGARRAPIKNRRRLHACVRARATKVFFFFRNVLSREK